MLEHVLFTLKKLVSFWLMPVPACLVLATLGWCVLSFPRRARLGRALMAVALLLLLLFGNKLFSTWLLRPLETRYSAIPEVAPGKAPPPALACCQYVVVLGGGHEDVPGLADLEKLSTSSLGRISEAVRLLRLLPAAKLLLSGPGEPGRTAHASILAGAAESLGVAADRIQLITFARDTGEESRAVKAIVGNAPIALVTSAWHMPRAEALFLEAGVHALPCPADYMAKTGGGFQWDDLGWDVESLDRSTRAVHEDLGILANRIQSAVRGRNRTP
jgi:uncharacterized SAM-binding protein YcdF (DUF218 family)